MSECDHPSARELRELRDELRDELATLIRFGGGRDHGDLVNRHVQPQPTLIRFGRRWVTMVTSSIVTCNFDSIRSDTPTESNRVSMDGDLVNRHVQL